VCHLLGLWAGLAMGLFGHGLGRPLSGLAMVWGVHVVGRLYAEAAVVWGGHRLNRPWRGPAVGCWPFSELTMGWAKYKPGWP
jgi:hypothetical protein